MTDPLPERDSGRVDIVVGREAGPWTDADEATAVAAARAALAAALPADIQEAEMAVVLADDALVRQLNRDYRGKDRPTNVLSFALTEGDDDRGLVPDPDAPIMLGDVILAHETIAAEARDQGKAFPDHLGHLVVHGVLHLLGHDHMTDGDADRMERLEVQVLARLGVADPYAGCDGDPPDDGPEPPDGPERPEDDRGAPPPSHHTRQ